MTGLSVPASSGGLLTFLDALALGGGVRVVFLPVVDGTKPGVAFKEADGQQRGNECPRLAVPVSGKLDVLVRHAVERSVPALRAGPEKKDDQRPAAGRPKPALQFSGLVVS